MTQTIICCRLVYQSKFCEPIQHIQISSEWSSVIKYILMTVTFVPSVCVCLVVRAGWLTEKQTVADLLWLAALWHTWAEKVSRSGDGPGPRQVSWRDGGDEALCFLQRELPGDLPPGPALVPAGWAGHGDRRHAAGPCAGEWNASESKGWSEVQSHLHQKLHSGLKKNKKKTFQTLINDLIELILVQWVWWEEKIVI